MNKKSQVRLFYGLLIGIFLIGIIYLVLVSASPGTTEISTCSVLNTAGETYLLTANVNSSGTCINITANDVTLNCQGYLINYSQTARGHGINISYYNNSVIKNCRIFEGGGITLSRGIHLDHANNVTIINNTITTSQSYGINVIYSSNNNNISYNTIFSKTTSSIHVFDNSINNFISYNYLYPNGTTSSAGINFDLAPNNIIHSNIIISSDPDVQGMWLDTGSHNLLIYNNTITVSRYALQTFVLDNLTIRNNKLTSTDNYALYLVSFGSLSTNLIYNNFINSSASSYDPSVSENFLNYWNTTSQLGTRIYSNGTQIGGNYWTNSSGTGYSDTCTDADTDGFCDLAYDIMNNTAGCTSNNCDYLPLSSQYVEGSVSFFNILDLYNYSSPFVTSNSSIPLGWNIYTTQGLSQVKFNWDSTNYSIYDSSLVFMSNFDNRSALNENDSQGTDISMYGNNFTIIGEITWTPNGKYNGAFNFSGGIGSINIGNVPTLNFTTNDFTISMWFNSRDVTTKTSLFSKYANGYGAFIQDGVLYFEIYNGSSHPYVATSLGFIVTNKWYYITCVKNSTNLILYFNGNYYDSAVSPLNIDLTNTNSFRIGSSSAGNTQRFNGLIDDFMVFNKSLFLSEINQLYKSSLTKYNSQNWTFQTNQHLDLGDNYYYLCSSNLTGSEICSSSKNIIKGVNTIIANFTNSIGVVSNNFYGVVSNPYFLTDSRTFNRQSFLDSGMNYVRMDMGFNTYSTSEGVYNPTELTNKIGIVTWAKANDIKILWIADYMPNWLANRTEGWCSKNMTCPPTNHTKWGILVTTFLSDVGCDSNTCEVEVWNEPDLLEFWMNDTAITNINRSIEYNKLYNATYLAVKSLNSSYQVGGASTTGKDTNTNLIMLNWMGNFSNQIDFVSHHEYLGQGSFTDFHSALEDDYSWIYSAISTYNVNTSRIIISEFNVWDDAVRLANGNEWAQQLAQAYEVTLNSYPANVSLMEYSFVEEPVNSFQMINGSDNFIFISYNVTKSFATYCPAGSTVFQSSSDDNTIKVVTCKDNDKYNVIVINTDTVSKNVTKSATGFSGTKAYQMDISNGNLYLNNNTDNLGIMDSYDIKYLGTPAFTLRETNNLTKTAPTDETYVSNEMWISSKVYSISGNTETYVYHLASNLSISLNLTFIPSVACPNSISYTSHSGITYTPSFSCSGTVVTSINLTNLEPSTSSNILTLTYYSGTQGGGSSGASTIVCYEFKNNQCNLIGSYGTSCPIDSFTYDVCVGKIVSSSLPSDIVKDWFTKIVDKGKDIWNALTNQSTNQTISDNNTSWDFPKIDTKTIVLIIGGLFILYFIYLDSKKIKT